MHLADDKHTQLQMDIVNLMRWSTGVDPGTSMSLSCHINPGPTLSSNYTSPVWLTRYTRDTNTLFTVSKGLLSLTSTMPNEFGVKEIKGTFVKLIEKWKSENRKSLQYYEVREDEF